MLTTVANGVKHALEPIVYISHEHFESVLLP